MSEGPTTTTTITVETTGAPAIETAATPAHTQSTTLHVAEWYPAHGPRESDPHYHLFHEAHARLLKAGKLVCWVCGKDGAASGKPIELHHAKVEFALANGIDLPRFEAAFPELEPIIHGDEDAFLSWIEGEGNLLCLCKLHHTGVEGIHNLPYPIWECLRYWRADLPLPGVVGPPVTTTP